MATAEDTNTRTKPKRRWNQFSLLTLLIAITVLSVVFWRAGIWYQQYLRDQAFIVPTDWDIGTGKNIKWKARLGSQAYSTPVVSGGKVFIGTNNNSGWLKRYPPEVDLGVLLCFRESDGAFLWQASSEKLRTGRVHDWPLQGIYGTVTVEGDRLWYITNRCEVVCLDTEGFYDGENDGPFRQEDFESKEEADVVWKLDMMTRLGVSPHNASAAGVALHEELLFAVTGNSVDEAHFDPPAPDAPSFIAVEKKTGRVVWSDASPGKNILHGQWSVPVVATLGGVLQVLFPSGDGWLYSFDVSAIRLGKTKLLWKFDCNPKASRWVLGGRGTRNNLIAPPVVHDGLIYIAVGQDPEHAEGPGHLWCIDPTKRGDVSPELVFNKANPSEPIPHKRWQACVPADGDFVRPNPNSAVVWHYDRQDSNGDGAIDWEEEMHRSLSRAAIKDGLLFIADYSGLFHCLDAKTGKVHWTYDLLAACWASPLIAGDHVYIGDEDGDVAVFKISSDPTIAMPNGAPVSETNMGNSTYGTPSVANNVLFLANKANLYAIAVKRMPKSAPSTTPPAGSQQPVSAE